MVGLGAVFSLIFHLGTKEKPYPLGSLPQPESTPLLQKEPTRCPRPLLAWKDWLLEPAFYQVGAGWATAMPPSPSSSRRGLRAALSVPLQVAVLYMATRLIVNLSQTYIAMYLTNSLLLPKVGTGQVPARTAGSPGQGSRASGLELIFSPCLSLAEIHRHHPPGAVRQRLPVLLPHEACE